MDSYQKQKEPGTNDQSFSADETRSETFLYNVLFDQV